MSKNTPRIIPNQIINTDMCYYHYYRPRCNNDEKRGTAFLAFVFCVFFYGCIFYVCSVSPCDVMSDVRFLFFFSNTLVLVIAADYGMFVSMSSEENVEESFGPVPCGVAVKMHGGGFAETDDNVRELTVVGEDVTKEEEGRVPCSGLVKLSVATYAENDNDAEELEEGKVVEDCVDIDEEVELLSCDDIDIDEDGEGSKVVEEEDRVVAEEEESDEFSWMSDEELNKRVEEFIQRLKTQIRQQAARDAE